MENTQECSISMLKFEERKSDVLIYQIYLFSRKVDFSNKQQELYTHCIEFKLGNPNGRLLHMSRRPIIIDKLEENGFFPAAGRSVFSLAP